MNITTSAKNVLICGVATATMLGGFAATAGSPAAAAGPAAATSVSSVAGSGVDVGLRDAIVRKIQAAQGALQVGGSTTVHEADGVRLELVKSGADSFRLDAVVAGAAQGERGFCHSAAMAAVYAIGAAAFAAAALVGGITVLGVAISASAAQSMSIALAAGSGVSALVSAYIC